MCGLVRFLLSGEVTLELLVYANAVDTYASPRRIRVRQCLLGPPSEDTCAWKEEREGGGWGGRELKARKGEMCESEERGDRKKGKLK